MNAAVSCHELVIRYRQKNGRWIEAVQGLDLEVRAGEVVGFLGPNGAGKSSTLKALMGFVTPASGTCEIFGHPAGTVEAKRRIGYLPEVSLYYPYLTPLETLILYGELQGLRGTTLRKESEFLLARLGVGEQAKKLNRTLSKGQLQRVGIAQSLLGAPELLILDEVTSGLDPIGRQELRGILKEKHGAGATLFFSSHELAEVEMLCDRILLINRGRVLEERNIDSLKEELRQYAIEFSGNASMVGLTEDIEILADGQVRARFSSKDALLQAMERVQQSGKITDVVAQDGSLEEYFVGTIARAA